MGDFLRGGQWGPDRPLPAAPDQADERVQEGILVA